MTNTILLQTNINFSSLELTELKKQGLLGKRVYAMGGISLEHIPDIKTIWFRWHCCGKRILEAL